MGRKRWRTWRRKNIDRKEQERGVKGEQEEEKEKEKDKKKEQKKMGVKGEEEEMEPPLFRVFRKKDNLPAFSLLAFMVIGAQEATLPC